MRSKTTLEAADCQTILAACKKEAQAQKWPVSIAVVDDGGYLLHLERMDGAPVQSPEIARRKAFSAAVSRMTTKQLEDMVKERPSFLAVPDRLPLQGGIPLAKDGVVIGAIGVSGVKSHEDEIVAEAGKKALLG